MFPQRRIYMKFKYTYVDKHLEKKQITSTTDEIVLFIFGNKIYSIKQELILRNRAIMNMN